jgi:hypothetical protein
LSAKTGMAASNRNESQGDLVGALDPDGIHRSAGGTRMALLRQ